MEYEQPKAKNKGLKRLRNLVGHEVTVFFSADKSERGFLDSYNIDPGCPFIVLVCYDHLKFINLRYVMLIEEVTEDAAHES